MSGWSIVDLNLDFKKLQTQEAISYTVWKSPASQDWLLLQFNPFIVSAFLQTASKQSYYVDAEEGPGQKGHRQDLAFQHPPGSTRLSGVGAQNRSARVFVGLFRLGI